MIPTTRETDFERHNEEVHQVWEAYRAGNPSRVPMIIGHNPRFTTFGHEANPRGITFQDTFSDPQLMLERQLEHQFWARTHIPQDAEMGLPKDGWSVYVDFQNSCEAGWFGCEIRFAEGEVPDTLPMLADDANKRLLFERGVPDLFQGGLMARNWEFYDYFLSKQAEGWEWNGRPIASVSPTGLGTDGPVTLACNLRGATEFMVDLLDDPDYADELLQFVTRATIARISAYRKRLGLPERPEGFGFADDSIQLLSTEMVRERVLPHYRLLVDELSSGGPVSIHLCGNATRHFPMLRDELGVRSFDTGFPVDFAWLRSALGPDVEVLGGPSAPFLQTATPEQTALESKRILHSGIMEGGRFILREGNNLPPGVTMDNLWAMYDAAHQWGRYE